MSACPAMLVEAVLTLIIGNSQRKGIEDVGIRRR